jgi:DNA-binding FrmR family transcriptional regulator
MALKAALETKYLSEEDKKILLNRINRLKGHADSVARMIDSGECVDVILTQVAALKGATSQLAIELVRHHLAKCATTCMGGTHDEVIKRVANALASVM